MKARLDREERIADAKRAAADHSHAAYSIFMAERTARELRRNLDTANFYTNGRFTSELEAINVLIKRLGDRRRRLMSKPVSN